MSTWRERIDQSQGRTRYCIAGQDLLRLPVKLSECPGCLAKRAEVHVLGCGQETCPLCDGYITKCGCTPDAHPSMYLPSVARLRFNAFNTPRTVYVAELRSLLAEVIAPAVNALVVCPAGYVAVTITFTVEGCE